MSNIDTRHNVLPFVAGNSEPLNGQRLAKVGYKTTKKNPAKLKSVCVSVPMIQPEVILANAEILVPYVRMMLEDTQDKVIRALYEGKNGALTSVDDSEIDIQACIGFLELERTGGRLTREQIEQWFDSDLSDPLMVVLAEKLGFTGDELTDAQTQAVEKHLKGYREVFASLAGGKTFLQPNQIQGLRNALKFAEPESEMVTRLNTRLDNMEKKPEITELLDI